MPWVINVFSKKALPFPSEVISSLSCSIWSLSLIDSALDWGVQASRTVFIVSLAYFDCCLSVSLAFNSAEIDTESTVCKNNFHFAS